MNKTKGGGDKILSIYSVSITTQLYKSIGYNKQGF